MFVVTELEIEDRKYKTLAKFFSVNGWFIQLIRDIQRYLKDKKITNKINNTIAISERNLWQQIFHLLQHFKSLFTYKLQIDHTIDQLIRLFNYFIL